MQIFDHELDDLIQLKDLSEFALLYKLRMRYNSGKIYTRVGAVLVAVNPYQSLPIFSEETIMEYVEHVSSTLMCLVLRAVLILYYSNLVSTKRFL